MVLFDPFSLAITIPGENRGLTTENQPISTIRSIYWRI